jgi:hypothetical protein
MDHSLGSARRDRCDGRLTVLEASEHRCRLSPGSCCRRDAWCCCCYVTAVSDAGEQHAGSKSIASAPSSFLDRRMFVSTAVDAWCDSSLRCHRERSKEAHGTKQ